jgi:hypothetical protein
MSGVQGIKHALHEFFSVRAFASGGFAQGSVHSVAKFLKLDRADLVTPLQEPQRFANGFTGRVVASRLDLGLDELLKLRTQMHGHGRE